MSSLTANMTTTSFCHPSSW